MNFVIRVTVAFICGFVGFGVHAQDNLRGASIGLGRIDPSIKDEVHYRTKLDYSTSPVALSILLAKAQAQEVSVRVDRGFQIGFDRRTPDELRGDMAGRIHWQVAEDGTVVGAMTVKSPEAKEMRIAVQVELPTGSEVRFFGLQGIDRRYPVLTPIELQKRNNPKHWFWSPYVNGDVIGIEISLMSWDDVPDFALEVVKVGHVYVSPRRPRIGSKPLECDDHIDVLCRTPPFGNEPKYGVGRIVYESEGGHYVCSGTLLNSTPRPRAPYFITAWHCIGSQLEADSVEIRWGYWSVSCGSSDAEYGQFTDGGADLLRTSDDQDMTLLRLRSNPPSTARYNGWNSGGIEHPLPVHSLTHPRSRAPACTAGRSV